MNELNASSSSKALEGVQEEESEGLEEGATGEEKRNEEREEEDNDDDDIVDFEPGQLSSDERRTLEASIKLSEAAGKVLRAISKPLLQGVLVYMLHLCD